jgi:RNA polymerase sigma factor (sigma-70 family)
MACCVPRRFLHELSGRAGPSLPSDQGLTAGPASLLPRHCLRKLRASQKVQFGEPFAVSGVLHRMSELSDEQLVARLPRDPEIAFRQLYQRYSSVLLRFIYRFTGNQQLAEEILHDIFLELLNGRHAEFPPGGLKSWLFTVAKNKSLNHLRRQQRETPKQAAPFCDWEEKAALQLDLHKLEASEMALPEDLRATWNLRRTGLDYQQIAEILSVPLGTVKSRLNRLITFLREEFEK